MNTYNLTDIELQELRNARVNLHKGLAALRFEVDGSIVDELADRLKTLEALYNKAILSGAKKEDIQPVPNHVEQTIIYLYESCWFKHNGKPIFNAKLFGERVAEFIETELLDQPK